MDFSRPYMDAGYTQLANTLQLDPKALEGKSLSEVREFYVETYMADKPADESERAWKHELQLHFDGIQHVKDMKAQAEDDAKEYWETHPKELQQALEAGLTNEADYKDAILEKEGIKKTAAMRRIRPGRRSR